MKVLIVTGIFPPDHGGPASYVPSIATSLVEYGQDVIGVITLSDCQDANDNYQFPVVRILRKLFWPRRAIQTITTIVKFARNADVVYLNGLVLEGVVATKLFLRKPVVVKVVGDLIWEKARNQDVTKLELDDFQVAKLPLYWIFLRKLQCFYLRQADAVITPSKYLAKIVAGWKVNPERIHVVYNAVELPNDISIKPNFYDYDLITVARLVPWKGLVDLIKVAAQLDCSLLVVGDGPMRSQLEKLALIEKANVKFVGNVPHEEVAIKMRSAKLFVLNSTYEGLPHIVLEAKASRTPVLASTAGGTSETINHAIDGWLVPINDKEALATAIQHILRDDQLSANLSEAGFNQIGEKFSSSAQVTATISILSRVSEC